MTIIIPTILLSHSCSFSVVADYIFAYVFFNFTNDSSNFFLPLRNYGWLVVTNSGRHYVRLYDQAISHAKTVLSLAQCDWLPHPAETTTRLNPYRPMQGTKTYYITITFNIPGLTDYDLMISCFRKGLGKTLWKHK